MRLDAGLGQQLPHAAEQHHTALLHALCKSDVGLPLSHHSQQRCTQSTQRMQCT